MTSSGTNSLSRASSAYLRSAMHQPIQWHEWGDEAFAAAQRENKPMLLDIGAVWCHWCHVMDRESYDSPEVAELINERFIAVKVDRDERPDIDSRYQVAISAITGQGGWPLTAFLTPHGKPFYGGTYFPPDDGYGRPSFKRVLLAISDAYHNKNADVTDQAKMVEAAIAQNESFAGKSGDFTPKIVNEILQSSLATYDGRNGGFGSAPKFPHPAIVDLIIDRYVRTGDDQLRDVFVTTLQKMANGGMYDQLAGGFHRYSVDEHWTVPHFEKMSYDNSELLKCYVHAFQVTGSEFFANTARDIIRWMDEWLSDRENGGFYASQDADYSMDDDGDYFTWTLDEARAVLTEAEAAAAALYYDINEVGEMHHNPAKNVLYVRATIDDIATRLELDRHQIHALIASARTKMYAARLTRPTPYVDKTVYVGWNALCISAYLQAALVLGLEDVRHFALRSLDRLLAKGWNDKHGLLHVIAYSDPNASHRNIPGVLDDYAETVVACLDAYETTSDLSYYNFAYQIARAMVECLADKTSGGFFDTAATGKELGVLATRRKPFQDSPTPAGNSMAAIALLRLYAYTGDRAFKDISEGTLSLLAAVAGRYGLFAGTYGIAATLFFEPELQVVVIGQDDTAARLYREAVERFALNKSVLKFAAGEAVAQHLPPALAETIPNLPVVRENRSAAVVCSGFACQPPSFQPDQLRAALDDTLGQKKGAA
jgi:uncharacterized protein YyaL (SSP411 family)